MLYSGNLNGDTERRNNDIKATGDAFSAPVFNIKVCRDFYIERFCRTANFTFLTVTSGLKQNIISTRNT